jgi:hypothetical protein
VLNSRSSWLVLILTCVLVWACTPSELLAQQQAQSSFRLQTSVMGSAGFPGASGAKHSNGTMGQPTPIGMGASSGKIVYAGFWSKPWIESSILDIDSGLPLTNCIHQNFPNPFMHATTIAYSLARESDVDISVFNVRGQKVKTLISGHASPGRHFTSWDGRSDMSPEIRDKILSLRHTGFNTHSKVRTTTLEDAGRVARYMAKPILALGRLAFDEAQGKVIYRHGKADDDKMEVEYLDFIARVTTHIPDKGQVMIRYYGLYSNAHRGVMKKRGQTTSVMSPLTPPPSREASPGWRELIRKIYQVDPLTCPVCGAEMKPIAFITNYAVIDKIIHHLGITFTAQRPPPPDRQEELY